MPRTPRSAVSFTAILGLLLAPLTFALSAPAQADVSTKIAAFPYSQDWSSLTATSTWADFPGVEGFSAGTSIAGSNQPNTTDVGTLTAEGTLTSNLVLRTGTAAPNTDSNGGVLVYPNLTDKTVALSATGSVTTPLLVFHLDTTGKSGIGVDYDIKDLDSSADDQPTRVALQYRVGTSGAYTNVPSAYVSDATVAGNTTVTSTHVSAVLPSDVDGQADVFLRVITLDNASGSNEHIGIDDIEITAGDAGGPLEAVDPGAKTLVAHHPMDDFTLQATGGTAPYTWAATGLPAGTTVSPEGVVSGTPTETGAYTVTATATDSAEPAATASTEFVLTVEAPAPLEATPLTGSRNGIEGVSMKPFTLEATGGVPAYSWSATGLPAGVTINTSTGELTGTPIEAGDFEVTATVTDSATPAASSQVTFDLVVAPVVPVTIAEVQGTTDYSPYAGAQPGQQGDDYVGVEGVITASYDSGSGNLAGFFMQSSGAPDTAGASDGIFVYMGGAASASTYAVGDSVEVIGRVSEYFDQTQISSNAFQVEEITALPAPAYATRIPGTDCVVGECPTEAELDQLREVHEGEAFDLTDPFTVSDSYSGGVGSSQMRGEFGLAANSTVPLAQPLEVVRPSNAEGLADHKAYNRAHGIVLDDGATTSYSANNAFPWLTLTNTVRAGAAATFEQPVVLDWRYSAWRLQPNSRIPSGDDGSAWVRFEQDRPASHEDVLKAEGNLEIATFNMLNYFTHPAQEWDNLPDDAIGENRRCTYYTDRAGARITARECLWKDLRLDPPSTLPDIGPRGAATAASLSRQQVKEVAAINEMASDVVSLEEVENPVKLGYADRDEPLSILVDALNAEWADRTGEDTVTNPRWAFVPSPRREAQPTIAEQDAIRNAFIYNPRVVETVGRSRIALNDPAFRNAREPLAQAFRHVDGQGVDDAFLVITNHFKSKGAPMDPSTMPADSDNQDTGNGAGWYNGDRTRQAKALDVFAKSLIEDTGVGAVFMAGDYNAYGKETPVTTLNDRGWNLLHPDNDETTYFFGGLAGSLDHVFANDEALAMVQGTTVWPINANEPVYYEYSRYNYNVTPLYDETAFRSSDHNPEIVGIKAPIGDAPAAVDTVQVLASNDFHGRLLDDPNSASAGAAAMAEAVKSLRADNPNTVFSMAGDIVGASTFESFIQNDKPTIDAMNEAGLEVSAAGNHEFDQGYDDLMDRIMSEYDATANPEGGATWPYIAANVRVGDENGPHALETHREDGHFANSNGATWWKEFPALDGGAGINVGFVGAVTEDLDSLVAPEAIEGLAITGIVDEVNAAAADLKTDGCGGEPCDLVIELVHEGAPTPSCSTINDDTTSAFGKIVHGASTDIDAIVSGHTHLKYNCKVPVTGKPLDRPVVSAGQYGSYLNQLRFDFEPGTDTLVGIRQRVLGMKDFDEDAATKAIVDDAVQEAEARGSVELGQVEGPFKRARRIDEQGATVENRGGESTLGNQVAEMQRWRTGADIGVMNPGGLRDDLLGTDDGPGPVSYREAANVQPFANTLVTTELTGAQVKLLLEQQWQRDPDGNTPSRPFLRLGTSKGFTFTEDSSRAEGDRITGMWLDGVAIDPAATYTVAANSFVASGGDNFRAFTLGTNTQDTGFTDLQATVDYLAEFAGDTPLPVDHAQHAVGARVPAGPFSAGDTVTVPVDSLSMTGAGDPTDSEVAVSMGGNELGTFPVTTALPTTPYDVPGAGTASFELPAGLSGGTQWFTLTGATTGTVAKVPVTVKATSTEPPPPPQEPVATTVSGTDTTQVYGKPGAVNVSVTPADATGVVQLLDGATVLAEGPLTSGGASLMIAPRALEVGRHTLVVKYAGSPTHAASQSTVTVRVKRQKPTLTVRAPKVVKVGSKAKVVVKVRTEGYTATGKVRVVIRKAGTRWKHKVVVKVVNGKAVARMKTKGKGKHVVRVKYLGDSHTRPAWKRVNLRVR